MRKAGSPTSGLTVKKVGEWREEQRGENEGLAS